MATQILAAVMERAGVSTSHDQVTLRQYHPADGRITPLTREVPTGERPPAAEYLR
jgi:hypothetical protein